eukprot:GHVS01016276.1.p1 GENE.GHVS01016276.1~~GHVS01016276.1.p1  ORF type:complete len:245 (-),score=14.64 GHVS01016276.1:451-1185(-)
MDFTSAHKPYNTSLHRLSCLFSTNESIFVIASCCCALLLLLISRLCYWFYRRISIRPQQQQPLSSPTICYAATRGSERTVKTMVVLGSGGHTKEMLELTSRLNMRMYRLTFVTATTDYTSLTALLHKQAQKSEDITSEHFDLAQIRRCREVGQPYISSCWSCFIAFLDALQLVCRYRPDLLLINGPGTCLPVCYAALFCELILFRPVKIVFIESFCRVTSLSLTGILVYLFVDRYMYMLCVLVC